MKTNNALKCPHCGSSDTATFKCYQTVHNGARQLFLCKNCHTSFSETSDTAMKNIKSSISKVASELRLRSEGLGLRATGRLLESNKRTISEWESRFADQKATLMLYGFCHKFVSLTFEGDELYTIVGKRTDPMKSEGWTVVIMDRASRFIVDQRCGQKNIELFMSVMETMCQYADQTDELSFLSDGERRYGNVLFADTTQDLPESEIHANPRRGPKCCGQKKKQHFQEKDKHVC